MNKLASAFILLFTTFTVFADENCPGKVTAILDYPVYCDGNLAFKLDVSGGKWICSLSDKSDSIVLLAYSTGKTLDPRLELPTPGDCSSVTHYQKPIYLSVRD